MYVRLRKAMYGMITAALIYHRKMSKELREYGFIISPYDPCVANKWTEEGQLTVVWNVDNMKVSHKNKEEVKQFVEYMKEIYKEKIPVVRGKKHSYVKIDLGYSLLGEVIVSMESYITEAIEEFPKEMMKTIKTPTGIHLFKFYGACVKLCKRDKIVLHQLVAKLLFLSKCTRSYIQPKIAFLVTRFINPDEDDWKKLLRVLSYLDATINSVKLHLNTNDLNVVHWWVYVSYGTHPYLKVQTGVIICIGKGCVKSASINKN